MNSLKNTNKGASINFFLFRIKFHCIRKENKLYLKHVSVLIACPRVSRKPLTVIEGGRYYYVNIPKLIIERSKNPREMHIHHYRNCTLYLILFIFFFF